MRIEVIEQADKKSLTRDVWRFWINYPHIFLDGYAHQSRRTTRHKWESVKIYSRINSRDYYGQKLLPEPDTVPEAVLKQAYLQASNSLQFMKWSDRR